MCGNAHNNYIVLISEWESLQLDTDKRGTRVLTLKVRMNHGQWECLKQW